MLEEDVVREIEEVATENPFPTAAAIDALKIVQRRHRWISDEHLSDTARLLGMSESELEALATFYSQLFRRPVGRHIIQVCDGVMCWMVGDEGILAELQRLGAQLGETTQDDRFTLLPVSCVGACHRAPAMLIDGELYEGIAPKDVETLLARYP